MGLHPSLSDACNCSPKRGGPERQGGRRGPSRPAPACQFLQHHFAKPRSPTRGPQTPPGKCCRGGPQPLRSLGVRSRLGPRTLAPCAPGSGSGPRSGPRRRGPSLSGPCSQPLPRGAPQPLCPVLTPHPVHVGRHGRSRRRLRPHKGSGRLGGAGLGSRRSPERGAGASLSLGRARAAGTSAASAVAAHPGPRCRRRRCRLTPRTPRPAPVRSASSGTSSAAAGSEPGSGVACPRGPHQTLGSARRGEGWPWRPGVRLLPEHLRRTGRTRPGARLRSESETPPIGHFRKRFGSLRPTAARRSVISVAARPLLRGRERSRA